ncbi:LCP family protein [Lachnospiraceae bacterium 62-35]
MSYEYEDELERMKRRRQQRKQPNNSKKHREHDFISAHQEKFENRKIRHSKALRRHRRKKRIFLLVEIIALFLLAAIIFSTIKKKNDDGYLTIAVFGVDSRDGKLGKGTLSDVEMLFCINKETGEVKIVSVFRDTYLKISSKGEYHKINKAYSQGGPKQAVAALEENLDIQIDSYATFNWKAVVDAINILGGVDVEISEAEFAYINSFITETVDSTNVGSHHLEHAGMNHLDGVQAVAYARLRLMDTDFNRTARQRKIVELAMEKAKNADWATRNNVLVTVFPQISTNIGIDDIIPMAKRIGDYHIVETTGFPFSRESKMIGKMDCVIPTTLESNVVQLHQLLFNDTDYKAPSSVKKISSRIAEESGLTEAGENAAPAGTGGGRLPKKQEEKSSETISTTVDETEAENPTEESVLETEEEAEESSQESQESTTDEYEETSFDGPGSGLKPSAGSVKPGDGDSAEKSDTSQTSGGPEPSNTENSSSSVESEIPASKPDSSIETDIPPSGNENSPNGGPGEMP